MYTINRDTLPAIEYGPHTTDRDLCDTYDAFSKATGLPAQCAAEVLYELDDLPLTEDEKQIARKWLEQFIRVWDMHFYGERNI